MKKPQHNHNEYNQKLYHFSGFTENDVNLVKLIFRLYIPKVIVKHFDKHFDNYFWNVKSKY